MKINGALLRLALSPRWRATPRLDESRSGKEAAEEKNAKQIEQRLGALIVIGMGGDAHAAIIGRRIFERVQPGQPQRGGIEAVAADGLRQR